PGNPDAYYFMERLPNIMGAEISNALAAEGLNIPGGYDLVFSIAMDVLENVNIDTKAIPDRKRQRKINQILFEWNKRLLNPNIIIQAVDFNAYRYTGRRARFDNFCNRSSEIMIGGGLATLDTLMVSFTPMKVPFIKSTFQPRLPEYQPGDISLTISYIYTYKEGTTRSGMTHQTYFRHWTDKSINFFPPDGGVDWVYVNQLELQLRGKYIQKAEYVRNIYVPYGWFDINPWSDYHIPFSERYSTHHKD
ncbi:MAG: hypothetical protein ACOC2J_01775, partial [bacterium]